MSTQTTEPARRVEVPTPVRALLVGGLIYLFLVGVSALENGIKIMGADTQARLFESVSNPIAGLCIGILGTVLVQSSSASTAVIVGLVATGNISVDDAVPMIMGANIGTTVTSDNRTSSSERSLRRPCTTSSTSSLSSSSSPSS